MKKYLAYTICVTLSLVIMISAGFIVYVSVIDEHSTVRLVERQVKKISWSQWEERVSIVRNAIAADEFTVVVANDRGNSITTQQRLLSDVGMGSCAGAVERMIFEHFSVPGGDALDNACYLLDRQ